MFCGLLRITHLRTRVRKNRKSMTIEEFAYRLSDILPSDLIFVVKNDHIELLWYINTSKSNSLDDESAMLHF